MAAYFDLLHIFQEILNSQLCIGADIIVVEVVVASVIKSSREYRVAGIELVGICSGAYEGIPFLIDGGICKVLHLLTVDI